MRCRGAGPPHAIGGAWLGADLRACLDDAGAVEATSARDLAFFREDREAV